jgi:D-aminopeptidase
MKILIAADMEGITGVTDWSAPDMLAAYRLFQAAVALAD